MDFLQTRGHRRNCLESKILQNLQPQVTTKPSEPVNSHLAVTILLLEPIAQFSKFLMLKDSSIKTSINKFILLIRLKDYTLNPSFALIGPTTNEVWLPVPTISMYFSSYSDKTDINWSKI